MTRAALISRMIFGLAARLGLLTVAVSIALVLIVSLGECGWRIGELTRADFLWSGQAIMRAVRSIAWAALIAGISTTIGSVCGLALASLRPGLRAIMGPIALLPLTIPSYLAYAGWGLARAPGSWLGDWLLAAMPPGFSDDPGFWPNLASRVQAVLGLSLWAWPIAALWVAAGCISSDAAISDSLRIDARSWFARQRVRLTSVRGSLLSAFICTLLLMLGSTTPMHLAQLDTISIKAWLTLAQSVPGDYFRAWAGTWPVVLAAMLGAIWWGARASRAVKDSLGESSTKARGKMGVIPLAFAICAAAGVPMILFMVSTKRWGTVGEFVTGTYAAALRQSLVDAGAAALVAGLACVSLATITGSAGPQRFRPALLTSVFTLLLLGTLLPGVLVGSTLARADHSAERFVSLGSLVVVLGQLARAGVIVAAVGWCAGVSAKRRVGDIQSLDGADRSPWHWLATSPRESAVMCGVGAILVAAVSIHEAEATVMTMQTGTTNLAWSMLQFLHLGRDDMLSAGVLVVTSVSIVLAGSAVLLLWVFARIQRA